MRSYVDPAATPTPVATLAARIPFPERNNIIPTAPPATTPTAVLINPTRGKHQSDIVSYHGNQWLPGAFAQGSYLPRYDLQCHPATSRTTDSGWADFRCCWEIQLILSCCGEVLIGETRKWDAIRRKHRVPRRARLAAIVAMMAYRIYVPVPFA